MSKNKHNNHPHNNHVSHIAASHAEEYRIIKHDLIRIFVVNVVFLAGLVSLYYYDQKTQILQELIAKYIHF